MSVFEEQGPCESEIGVQAFECGRDGARFETLLQVATVPPGRQALQGGLHPAILGFVVRNALFDIPLLQEQQVVPLRKAFPEDCPQNLLGHDLDRADALQAAGFHGEAFGGFHGPSRRAGAALGESRFVLHRDAPLPADFCECVGRQGPQLRMKRLHGTTEVRRPPLLALGIPRQGKNEQMLVKMRLPGLVLPVVESQREDLGSLPITPAVA